MKPRIIHIIFLCSLCSFFLQASAQEHLAPLNYNPVVSKKLAALPISGGTPLTLPFFDDFTGYSPYPDRALWADQQVYINNTMGLNPVSRGVATFDALNQNGLPYNDANPPAVVTADSLTSLPIDFTNYQPSDSIYLSFFYQPQGNGFSPESQDSLTLFMRKDSSWTEVWSAAGTTVQPFKQVMIPVRDPAFFHINFQFRFVNKASINLNDDVWNIDYVRLAANRNINDTAVNDVAYITTPTYLLNDYTYMPYHQFKANENGERSSIHSATFQNNYSTTQNITYGYTALDAGSGTQLSAGASNNASVNAGQQQQCAFPVYTNTVPLPSHRYDAVNFINKFWLTSPSTDNNKINDTVIREQLFHNFLAYDDGTAEKSYFLDLFETLPGKVAIEYHLNEPDTLSGIGIYFGRQAPLAYNKGFSVAVYSSITVGSSQEQVVYQEDLFQPAYLNINNFYYYKFKNKVPLPAGKFYLGVIQPAFGNSDSLYYGFDVNRVGPTHTYYNVLASWQPSTIPGALMIRPIVGPIIPSNVPDAGHEMPVYNFYPNPADDRIRFNLATAAVFEVWDIQGKKVLQGHVRNGGDVDIGTLKAGMYFVRVTVNGITTPPQKLIKL